MGEIPFGILRVMQTQYKALMMNHGITRKGGNVLLIYHFQLTRILTNNTNSIGRGSLTRSRELPETHALTDRKDQGTMIRMDGFPLFTSAGSIPKLFDSDFIIGTIFDFDYGRFWQIFVDRFFYDFDSEKLSRNRRFFDSSILIKINPAKKLVFLSFLSQKIKSFL